jgi:cation diffusion facilitator family transporter
LPIGLCRLRDHPAHLHIDSDAKRLGWAFGITASFMLLEVAGGLLSGSLALLADAGHMLTDAAALGLAWFAAHFTAGSTKGVAPGGHHRAQVLAAFVNALALLGVVGWILWEAIERFQTPREIAGGTMLGVALLGLFANLAVLRVLRGHDDGNLNVSAARLHVIGDLLGSVGATIAAVVILATGWTPIDPLLSVLVALLIVGSAWSLLRKSAGILLQDRSAADHATPELRNTLYRKVTRGRRRLTRGRLLLYRVAVVVAWQLVRLFWATCRVQARPGFEAARATVRESRSVIPVYWHQHTLFGVRALLDLREDGLKVGFLISPSVDGTAPAMLVGRIGGHVIRGSSTHTGARALRDYYETIVKQEISPAITPDGPRGPIHEFKPGAVMLSQITGKPILPVSIAASRTFRFRTWDRFELPLPFSRVVIAYGEPVRMPRGLDAESLSRMQVEMAASLQALQAEARAALLAPTDS